MKLERTFEWGKNYNTTAQGIVKGWKPIDAPAWFDHGAAIFLAHDTMEHLQPSDTSLEAEMRASGAAIAIRLVAAVEDEDKEEIANWVNVIAEDATAFCLLDSRELAVPSIAVPPLPEALEKVMVEQIAPGMTRVINAMHSDKNKEKAKKLLRWHGEDAEKRVDIARQWMRIGFKEASEVYAKLETHKRMTLFRNIRGGGDSMTAAHGAMPGDRITVTVDTETGKANMRYTESKQWSPEERSAAAFNLMMRSLFG